MSRCPGCHVSVITRRALLGLSRVILHGGDECDRQELNPGGRMARQMVISRSLFSLRCDISLKRHSKCRYRWRLRRVAGRRECGIPVSETPESGAVMCPGVVSECSLRPPRPGGGRDSERRPAGRSCRSADGFRHSGDDYCTTGFGQLRTFGIKQKQRPKPPSLVNPHLIVTLLSCVLLY